MLELMGPYLKVLPVHTEINWCTVGFNFFLHRNCYYISQIITKTCEIFEKDWNNIF